ncbi:unnamed protein product, partial [Tenebrio molitor]
RRKAWEKVLLLRKPAKRHMRVCGKHFLREDFINPPRSISQKLRLKKLAVPSQELPKRTHDTKKVCIRNDRQSRLEQRQIKKQKENIDPVEPCGNVETFEEDDGLTLVDVGKAERDAVNVLLNLSDMNVEPAKAVHDDNVKAVDICTNMENLEEDCGLTLADVGEAERDAVNVLLNLSDMNVEPAKAMYDEKGVQVKS